MSPKNKFGLINLALTIVTFSIIVRTNVSLLEYCFLGVLFFAINMSGYLEAMGDREIEDQRREDEETGSDDSSGDSTPGSSK